MDLVIDANILFAILIKSGTTEELFFHDDLCLFAPEFLLDEFAKYEKLILKKTHKTPREFRQLLAVLRRRIVMVPDKWFEPSMARAIAICPDTNDREYFALALTLDCAIWSNDKALKQQDHIKIRSTKELLDLLD